MKKAGTVLLLLVFVLSMVLIGCGNKESATSTSTGSNDSENSNDSNDSNDTTTTESKSESEVEETITLTLGHALTPDSERHLIATKVAEIAEQKSNGTIKINIFPQSQLGGEVKMIQGVRSSAQDMVITGTGALSNTIEQLTIFDLPYLFDDAEQANDILNGEVGKKVTDLFPQHDLIGLGWLWPVELNVFGNRSVKTVEDLKNLKIRTVQSSGILKTYEALGAQPTPMAYGEVYLSLQQGVIDGGITPPNQFMDDKFFEVSKYYSKTHIHLAPILLLINKSKWESMSPNQQEILQEAVDEALAFGVDYNKKELAKFYDQMKEAGIEVNDPDTEGMKKATEQVFKEILSEVKDGQELADAIQSAK